MIFSTEHIAQTTKKAHIISSLVCWILPCIPVAIVLASDKKYNVANMRYCFPADIDLVYFTQVMVTEIAEAVGCTCLFAVAYKLYTVCCDGRFVDVWQMCQPSLFTQESHAFVFYIYTSSIVNFSGPIILTTNIKSPRGTQLFVARFYTVNLPLQNFRRLASIVQGPVVRKLISTNPGLKVNQGFNTLV